VEAIGVFATVKIRKVRKRKKRVKRETGSDLTGRKGRRMKRTIREAGYLGGKKEKEGFEGMVKKCPSNAWDQGEH